MVQLGSEPHFAREIIERFLGDQMLMRNLECNLNAFERVLRAEHRRVGSLGKASLQLVFADFLAGL